MSDNFKSVFFAGTVAVVCSLLLTVAATGLKPLKLRNINLDRQKNILRSVGLVKADKPLSATEIESLYNANIQCFSVDGTGRIIPFDASPENLPICFYIKDKKPLTYIIPIDSRGLWGKIKGYLAIENDGKTVAGFSVYSHNETPGLGGEIEKPWFRANFKGKSIVDKKGNLTSVSIAKGKAKDAIPQSRLNNYVDGISGATLTGKFLTAGLKENLLSYENVSEQFRDGSIDISTAD